MKNERKKNSRTSCTYWIRNRFVFFHRQQRTSLFINNNKELGNKMYVRVVNVQQQRRPRTVFTENINSFFQISNWKNFENLKTELINTISKDWLNLIRTNYLFKTLWKQFKSLRPKTVRRTWLFFFDRFEHDNTTIKREKRCVQSRVPARPIGLEN